MRDFLIEAGLDRLAKRMVRVELYLCEIIHTACNLWLAERLLTPVSAFDLYPTAYAFMRSLHENHANWGLLAAAGAIAGAAGFALFFLNVAHTVSMLLRSICLLISGFIWIVVAFSFWIGSPNSVAAAPLVLIGASAWWILVRSPAVPKPLTPL